jgi:hypothetical protein
VCGATFVSLLLLLLLAVGEMKHFIAFSRQREESLRSIAMNEAARSHDLPHCSFAMIK